MSAEDGPGRVIPQAYPLYVRRTNGTRWLVVGWEESAQGSAWLPVMVNLTTDGEGQVARSWVGRTVGEMEGMRVVEP